MRRRRINNNNFYLQKKYSLLREDNRAFGRLLVEILNPNNFTAECLPDTLANIQCFLGYFDTDPNRVLDLLLLSLSMNISADQAILHGFITVIKEFKVDAISHLLGYKLTSMHQGIQE